MAATPGIDFMLHGNMACGVLGQDLIVRVGPAACQEALAEPDTREFDVTGRPMTGWTVVTADGHAADQALNRWLRKGIDFAASLPAK